MNEALEKIRAGLYYCIIGIISLIALFFLPALGSSVGIGLALPTTTAGWIVYIVTKVIIAVINILIFHCFRLQGKLNVEKHEDYIKAKKLLREDGRHKNVIPFSPSQWNRNQWLSKGITLFLTSILSVFALTQAVLSFDWIAMLTYLFTILMGLIFGVLQMKKEEEYWTVGYLEYAEYITNKNINSTEETQNGN